MGERIINPLHNVFKVYRKVNLVNPYLFVKPFESTWKTDNLSTGSSTATQVTLPLVITGTYNMRVDWGDGTNSTITAYNVGNTHTYSVAGTYTIKISGTCIGWQFNNTGDRLKILSVAKWGSLRLGNSNTYFYGCANLNLSSVDDILNLTGTNSLGRCFEGCTALTTIGRLNEWDMTSILSLSKTFSGCTNFDQNIGNWNISNVNSLHCTFTNCSNFNNGGSDSIKFWNVTNVLDFGFISDAFGGTFFGCSKFNQPIGSWVINTSSPVRMDGMFRNATLFNQDLSSWNVSRVTTMLDMFNNATAFNQNLNSWNTSNVISMQTMFKSNTNFNNGLAIGVGGTMTWNTSSCTAMQSMFEGATAFNQTVSSWDVSKVTNFGSGTTSNFGMFQGATSFNNGLASGVSGTLAWTINTTSNVTMAGMFSGAIAFNQNISFFNMSKVTTVINMFNGASTFNQDLGTLDLSSCTDFGAMFNAAVLFNNGGSSSINSWILKTTGTINMQSMFVNAIAFNQPIGGWNTIAVTNMSQMFSRSTAVGGSSPMLFNQPIGTWNVSNVTNMANMLGNINGSTSHPFNQNLSSWNVTKVTDFSGMFSNTTNFNNGLASGVAGTLPWIINTSAPVNMANMFNCGNFGKFNQDLNSWNVSRVTNMGSMFRRQILFNNGSSNSIESWNVSNVTNMQSMFQETDAFNYNLGSWNISNVTDFTSFMLLKPAASYSTANLDAIYNTTTGWPSRPVKPGIVITFGACKYTAAGSAGKALLQGAPNLWNITDGGI